MTLAWLKACLGRGELLPVNRLTPLFRPLPHVLPLPGFQGLTVAVSQFHVEQRDVLKTLIERLGASAVRTCAPVTRSRSPPAVSCARSHPARTQRSKRNKYQLGQAAAL